MKINVSVDLNDLWDECQESYSQVIKDELQHEFKLAVRRAMKADKEFQSEVDNMVKRMRKKMWEEQESLLAKFGTD